MHYPRYYKSSPLLLRVFRELLLLALLVVGAAAFRHQSLPALSSATPRRGSPAVAPVIPALASIRMVDDISDEEENDYQLKLKQADETIAATKEARRELQPAKTKPFRPLPPPNSLARVEFSDAGTMLITIPFKGLGTDSLFAGTFSLAWFSAIVPATLASGGASLLFLLPFWAAGGLVAKNAVVDPFVSGSLTIGEYAWSVENKYVGRKLNSKEGPTEQLRGAAAEVVAVVNSIPQAEIKLYTESGITAFGLGLSIEELEYLAGEINDHLSNFRTRERSDRGWMMIQSKSLS